VLQVVLVGDPKQLPATLFSRAAKELALERSLFERMNNVSDCVWV
jgi:superfamily I DNA and/or RNA helicase